jgi:hypothetical protein
MLKPFCIIILAVLVNVQVFAQNYYPQDDFILPLEIPIKLSGTFGELRSNHFHSGIDIKTGEKEGLKVIAIADGYVSRIKVQPGGYGKAIYISHPNGYVSVYCHLSKFNNGINEFVIRQQYQQQSYSIDLYPEKDQFHLKQGDLVAYSGNSGSSGGPHLHYEIRDEQTQKIINPLLFGNLITDTDPPVLNYLKIYPYGKSSVVNGKKQDIGFSLTKRDTSYTINGTDTISAYGELYFGINTIDLFNGGMNKNGVYSISLYVDQNMVYQHNLETFSFDETRYINSLIDYREYKTYNRTLQKTFIEPNNNLSLYKTRINNGLVTIATGKKYKIIYKITDINNNTSYLSFWIKGVDRPPKKEQEKDIPEKVQMFSYTKNNLLKENDIIFEVPGAALYDTLNFHYQKRPAIDKSYSLIHSLHFDYVPLHTWCNLSIWPDSLPISFHDKAIIVKVADDKSISSSGGQWEDGFIKTQVREFGN